MRESVERCQKKRVLTPFHGDVMPDMPLFLEPERHVLTPLEATYQAAWGELPEEIRELLE